MGWGGTLRTAASLERAKRAESAFLLRQDPASREPRHEIDYAHVEDKTDVSNPMRRLPGVRWSVAAAASFSSARDDDDNMKKSTTKKPPTAESLKERKERLAARSARAEARHVGTEGPLARRGRGARLAVDYAHVERKTDVSTPSGPVRGVRWGEGPAHSYGIYNSGGGGGGIVRQGRLAAPFGGGGGGGGGDGGLAVGAKTSCGSADKDDVEARVRAYRDEAAAARTRANNNNNSNTLAEGDDRRHPTRCTHCGLDFAELLGSGGAGRAEAREHLVRCAVGKGLGNFDSVL